jgi:hypothetical protein
MKLMWILYGLLLGLAPLLVGVAASEVDPHGWPSVLPWFTIATLPTGFLLGLFMAFYA